MSKENILTHPKFMTNEDLLDYYDLLLELIIVYSEEPKDFDSVQDEIIERFLRKE